jgi:hypothetical protein
LWSAPDQIGGARRTFGRPKVFFDSKGGMPPSGTLAFTVPRGYERAAFRKALVANLEEREREAAKAMKEEGKEPLGVSAILAQSPEGHATGEEKPRGRKDHVSAVDVWIWLLSFVRRLAFREAYGEALGAYRAGRRSTRFPPGTYLLRIHHGVACAAAG